MKPGLINHSELVRPYVDAWFDKMVQIWGDKLDLQGVYDTGALRRSVMSAGKGRPLIDDHRIAMTFNFLLYGIYVDLGVGNGYRHGNGGDLEILDDVYRHEHKMGNKRVRKSWFGWSWEISVNVLKNKMGEMLGEEYSRMFDDL